MRRRRVSNQALRRWLATSRPGRVEALLDSDQSVADRLEALTALDGSVATALEVAVAPPERSEARSVARLRHRQQAYGTLSALADIFALGYHVGRVFFEPNESDPGADNGDTPPAEFEEAYAGRQADCALVGNQ